MQDGPDFKNKLTYCFTKDNTELDVKYNCTSIIINKKAYHKHTAPGTGNKVLNVGWRDKLQKQIEEAIAYVLKYYPWDTLANSNKHHPHIQHQIKQCLNQNYQNSKLPLSNKGLNVQSIDVIKIVERAKLY